MNHFQEMQEIRMSCSMLDGDNKSLQGTINLLNSQISDLKKEMNLFKKSSGDGENSLSQLRQEYL
jgi:hypothetical protein